jgi:3-oxoacyl-(acyl-carrier-protein) synthase
MRDALAKGEPLPVSNLSRPGWSRPLRVRPAPRLNPRPSVFGHARLRRVSPIGQFAVSAGLEALGADAAVVQAGKLRLGIIFSVMTGCVVYSRRFYEETLHDAATASPLLFPETVFNAPASHLAAVLGSTEINYTLVGDPGMFLVGVALAAQWLETDRVDACLVIGAEENDWIVADASRRFDRKLILSEGAGALYLGHSSDRSSPIELTAITDAHSFGTGQTRPEAAKQMRSQLPSGLPSHLLCDGLQELASDRAEQSAWAEWPGARLSPKVVLGEGLAAASAWQCVAAIDALRQGRYAAATVSVVGCNQQAIGAHWVKTGPARLDS